MPKPRSVDTLCRIAKETFNGSAPDALTALVAATVTVASGVDGMTPDDLADIVRETHKSFIALQERRRGGLN